MFQLHCHLQKSIKGELQATKVKQNISYAEARRLVVGQTPKPGLSYSSVLTQKTEIGIQYDLNDISPVNTLTPSSNVKNKATSAKALNSPEQPLSKVQQYITVAKGQKNAKGKSRKKSKFPSLQHPPRPPDSSKMEVSNEILKLTTSSSDLSDVEMDHSTIISDADTFLWRQSARGSTGKIRGGSLREACQAKLEAAPSARGSKRQKLEAAVSRRKFRHFLAAAFERQFRHFSLATVFERQFRHFSLAAVCERQFRHFFGGSLREAVQTLLFGGSLREAAVCERQFRHNSRRKSARGSSDTFLWRQSARGSTGKIRGGSLLEAVKAKLEAAVCEREFRHFSLAAVCERQFKTLFLLATALWRQFRHFSLATVFERQFRHFLWHQSARGSSDTILWRQSARGSSDTFLWRQSARGSSDTFLWRQSARGICEAVQTLFFGGVCEAVQTLSLADCGSSDTFFGELREAVQTLFLAESARGSSDLFLATVCERQFRPFLWQVCERHSDLLWRQTARGSSDRFLWRQTARGSSDRFLWRQSARGSYRPILWAVCERQFRHNSLAKSAKAVQTQFGQWQSAVRHFGSLRHSDTFWRQSAKQFKDSLSWRQSAEVVQHFLADSSRAFRHFVLQTFKSLHICLARHSSRFTIVWHDIQVASQLSGTTFKSLHNCLLEVKPPGNSLARVKVPQDSRTAPEPVVNAAWQQTNEPKITAADNLWAEFKAAQSNLNVGSSSTSQKVAYINFKDYSIL
ncbi:hypothetical protein HNY73_000173 [Argiope bruennichi]|uniref:Uncharacterized protein n=1 Tax=Argiope bruennichi TaxID=94029 RepID=A0A8T0FYD2_ARGBR|nr:hypothetical protein HNY73_000173 [Argiope bruennichi]